MEGPLWLRWTKNCQLLTLIKRTSPYDSEFYNEHLNCSAARRPDHSQYIQKAWPPCACGNGCPILIERQIICHTGHTQVSLDTCTNWSYFPWQFLALSFLSFCYYIAVSHLKKLENVYYNLFWFVCVDALHLCQQFFSHARTISCFPGLNQY